MLNNKSWWKAAFVRLGAGVRGAVPDLGAGTGLRLR